MKKFKNLLLVMVSLVVTASLTAQTKTEGGDKSSSPYFFVHASSGTESLPLKSTRADVSIAGVMADVKVTQVYKNEGEVPIEAVYVFPASTRAAVHGLRMTIGERTITAKIEEKQKARQDFEEAKTQGKSATLLEQHRPNVFQMNVANIMPGDEITVELLYAEALIPEKGIYEFVYPTVVGPRYSNQPDPALTASAETWTANPYTTEGVNPFYDFDLSCSINTGIPIHQLRSTTHETDISYSSSSKAAIKLKASERKGGNRDFILQYQLKGEKIESGVLLYEGEKENFFIMMVQPPKRIESEMIPPREYVFIVDVSGSMNGFPLKVSKTLMNNLLKNLKPTDLFNIIFFSGGSNLLSPTSLTVTPQNIAKATQMLDGYKGGGGTEILPALQKALAFPTGENYSRSFVIVTDGYVSVEKEAYELIRKNIGNANFFSFGIGSSVNRYIIEGMARVGKGEPFIITSESEAAEKAETFREYIQSPVLTNVNVAFQGAEVYDVEPSYIHDIFADRPVMIYGKYRGTAKGTATVSGDGGKGKFIKTFNLSSEKASKTNSALPFIWARNKISMLDDYQMIHGDAAEIEKQVTEIGLNYNLLTAYTSFVAIDSEIRNGSGQMTSVNQPLPLPQGVSNHAVGGNTGAVSYNSPTRKVKRSEDYYSSGKPESTKDMASGYPATDMVMEELKAPAPAVVSAGASFRGGYAAMEKWISSQIRYPETAKQKGLSGTVMLEVEILADGSIGNVKVIRKLSPDLDQEAVRLARLMPLWNPALLNGKGVTETVRIPVKFVL